MVEPINFIWKIYLYSTFQSKANSYGRLFWSCQIFNANANYKIVSIKCERRPMFTDLDSMLVNTYQLQKEFFLIFATIIRNILSKKLPKMLLGSILNEAAIKRKQLRKYGPQEKQILVFVHMLTCSVLSNCPHANVLTLLSTR